MNDLNPGIQAYLFLYTQHFNDIDSYSIILLLLSNYLFWYYMFYSPAIWYPIILSCYGFFYSELMLNRVYGRNNGRYL